MTIVYLTKDILFLDTILCEAESHFDKLSVKVQLDVENLRTKW